MIADPKVTSVGREIASHLADLADLFKPGAKLTLLVRRPEHPDGSQDMVVTDDGLHEVIAALWISVVRGNAPVSTVMPCRPERIKDLLAVKIGYWETYLGHYAVADERSAVEKMIADLREIYTTAGNGRGAGVTTGPLDGPGISDRITWGAAVSQLKCWNCGVAAVPEFDGGTPWCKACGVVHDAADGVSQPVP
jgi:hypothetical protein